jgi:hypothetical protein
MILFKMRALPYGGLYMLGALVIGIYFLLIPGYRLYAMKTRLQAARLFNRASYYPLAILVMVATLMLWF